MPQSPKAARPTPWAHLWWVLTGALFGFGVVGILTIGIFFLAGAAVLGAVGLSLKSLRTSAATSTLAGVAAAPLYIAWLNRNGPGTVCEPTLDGTHCEGQWSPWPFVAVAVVLVAVTIGLEVRSRRHQRQ